MSSIVIQHIETIWTKASRGSDGARQRNQLPEAMKLPHFSPAGEFFLQTITMAEQNSFQPQEQILIATLFVELNLRVVGLEFVETTMRVRFYRDSYNAAKPTNYSFKDTFNLEQGQWGRIVYNGRFTDFSSGNWWYEKHVYNIGWFDVLESKQFLETKPDAEFQELAKLQ